VESKHALASQLVVAVIMYHMLHMPYVLLPIPAGAGSRSKCLVTWERLLSRQRAAVAAALHRARGSRKPTGDAAAAAGAAATPGGAGSSSSSSCGVQSTAVQRQLTFLTWLSQTLLDSLYPGEGIWTASGTS